MDLKRWARQMYHMAHFVLLFPMRNAIGLNHRMCRRKHVNLEWADNGNLGDLLGPLIYHWMLKRGKVSEESRTVRTSHLITCGSLIGAGFFDAVIWGSGAHRIQNIKRLHMMKGILKYDVRAVRGPVTKQILEECGYQCPELYGDPAILMPLIYPGEDVKKIYGVSVILHYYLQDKGDFDNNECHYLNIKTSDYKSFVNEIKASKKIISSSLHGLILAEAYGVPAVFLNTGGYVDKALIKYYDWYYSTNRWSVKMARTIEEAMTMDPMELPDLTEMRRNLIHAFPYDLWK